MPATLEPEDLSQDSAGLPYSLRYGDRYASRAGALGQARHVFLEGNRLPERWAGRRQFVILEMGFGLGNNFLATWQAWRADPSRPGQLHYVSVEKHPLRAADLAEAGTGAIATSADGGASLDDAAVADLRAALTAQWPLPLSGLHRLVFESGHVVLTLAFGDARDLIPQLAMGADAYYLDGFAPQCNPQMWEPALLRALSRLARPQATLATYSAAGSVREALSARGFTVQRVPGYGAKRHMLTAHFSPRFKLRRREPPCSYAGQRHALVVGAGLSGCCSALALVRRGWRVTMLERGDAPAAGASALPAGLIYPLLSADDNLSSRLSRAAYGFAIQALAELTGDEAASEASDGAASDANSQENWWSPCGVFQEAADDLTEDAVRARLLRDRWPEGFARFEDAATAAAHLGLQPRQGGTWFAKGAVVDAGRWCRAMITQMHRLGARSGGSLDVHYGFDVRRLSREADRWHVKDADEVGHAAPVLVLANAADLARLLALDHLPMQVLGGSLTFLQTSDLLPLQAAIGGDGYLVPPLLGRAAVGATYEAACDPADWDPKAPGGTSAEDGAIAPIDASAANLLRLAQLLARPPAVAVSGAFRGARCVSQDRLPLAGALGDEALVLRQRAKFAGAHLADLPRQSGLFCVAALGSRGLTLAPLLGELLAAQINGEPAPVEAALCVAVDPARFLLRHLRAPLAAEQTASPRATDAAAPAARLGGMR